MNEEQFTLFLGYLDKIGVKLGIGVQGIWPLSKAINVEDSAWKNLRKMLKENGFSENYFGWQSRLNNHF